MRSSLQLRRGLDAAGMLKLALTFENLWPVRFRHAVHSTCDKACLGGWPGPLDAALIMEAGGQGVVTRHREARRGIKQAAEGAQATDGRCLAGGRCDDRHLPRMLTHI